MTMNTTNCVAATISREVGNFPSVRALVSRRV